MTESTLLLSVLSSENYARMSRASIRMKQYRPVSADFTKVGTGLSAVFGLNQESNDEKSSNSSNGVLLINCK